ncbi:MAG: DUF4150 domain-containing protein, partial [bacterium]|nr:DUF4150 domain-containing protein [bacterium]
MLKNKSEFSKSNGDEAGTLKGIASSKNMAQAKFALYSFDVKVEGKKALNDFIRLPWSLYMDDPMWVPPLVLERRMQLSPGNPYFDHAKYCSWIACRDGNAVGRISAQIDRLYLDRHRNATGFFGMLESEDNARTFQLLLETAEAWLRNRGMQKISGPFNLSINQELGLLVDGFDTPPSVMMGHARP